MAKVLALRAQKTQLESKLQEWEEVHARTLGRPSTAQERQRSREHRELSRLVADVDAYIESLQGGGTGAPPPPQGGTRDAQRRAERGKIKAKMRRWERDFEKAHHRKPTEADIEASDDMTEWKSMLATTTEPSSSGGPVGIGGEDADVPSERADSLPPSFSSFVRNSLVAISGSIVWLPHAGPRTGSSDGAAPARRKRKGREVGGRALTPTQHTC